MALLQLVERREARRTRPGHFSRNLSSAQDDIVELPRGQKLPDRRQDETALSVARGGSFAESISRMEMGVTVRKHDEASANELTR